MASTFQQTTVIGFCLIPLHGQQVLCISTCYSSEVISWRALHSTEATQTASYPCPWERSRSVPMDAGHKNRTREKKTDFEALHSFRYFYNALEVYLPLHGDFQGFWLVSIESHMFQSSMGTGLGSTGLPGLGILSKQCALLKSHVTCCALLKSHVACWMLQGYRYLSSISMPGFWR